MHNLIKENQDDNNDLYTDGLSSDNDQIFPETEYLSRLYNNC